MDKTANGWVENKRQRTKFAEKQVEELEIKIPNISALCQLAVGRQPAKSGGGQLAKHQPQDYALRRAISGHRCERQAADLRDYVGEARKGISTIFVSTELEELLEVCHRILIMRHGRIVDEVDPDDSEHQ